MYKTTGTAALAAQEAHRRRMSESALQQAKDELKLAYRRLGLSWKVRRLLLQRVRTLHERLRETENELQTLRALHGPQ